jgi:stress response protein YsnF
VIEDNEGDFKKKSENAGNRNRSNASDEKSEQKRQNQEIDKTRVIPPKLPREFMHIVRPAYFAKENSIISLTSKLANTVKDSTDETISSIKQLAGPLIENNDKPVSRQASMRSTHHILADKKDIHDIVSIEKRWITKKTKIEVPVRYEKVFLNDQELRFGVEEALTEIKDRILDVVSVEHHKENSAEYNWVPLFGPDSELQTEFPLYAEELIISKRKVMVGKVIIRKRQITKKHNMDENQ